MRRPSRSSASCDYAKGQGVTDFAGLVPNGTYGERASTAFLRAVEARAARCARLQTYDRAAGSLTGAITRMAQNAPFGAVLIADSGGSAATAVPLIRRNGGGARTFSVPICGIRKARSPPGRRSTVPGSPACRTISTANMPPNTVPVSVRAPYRLSSLGYDSVLLTVRIARDWSVNTPFPEARLRDPGGFAGIDGPFRFGRDSVAERALEVQEIRGGTTVTVSPAPTGF